MFKETIKKVVTGAVAGAGTYLVGWGVVPADVWAQTSPELISAVSGTVGVVVAGTYNYALAWVIGLMAKA